MSLPANSEMSLEEIIKGRKALFSKNYSTAKRVQALAIKGEFDKEKSLMIKMIENDKTINKRVFKSINTIPGPLPI